MGMFRLYFSLLIVVGHLNYFWGMPIAFLPFITSGVAAALVRVHIFFLQSGFLTQLQLSRPLERGLLMNYYWRRAKSVYPQYYLFLTLMIADYAYFGTVQENISALMSHGFSPTDIALANVTALNYPLLGLQKMDYNWMTHQVLLLPTAWSLIMQIVFIILSPFILCSTWRLCVVTLLSTASMVYYYNIGWVNWHMIETELAYFWFGAWAVRFTRHVKNPGLGIWGKLLMLAVVIMSLCYKPIESVLGMWPTFILFHLCAVFSMMPAWVLTQSMAATDFFFARMAYTIYLCHWPIAFFFNRNVHSNPWAGLYVIAASIMMALLVDARQWGKKGLRRKISMMMSPDAAA